MAIAPQTTNQQTLSGLPVQPQPGAQLPYGPGASSSAGATTMQTSAVPGSVTTAGPVAPGAGQTVAATLEQIAAGQQPVAQNPVLPANQVVQGALDQFATGPRQDANQMVQDSLASFEDRGSAYMTNAARRGLETAASRGLGNSSIAAGASQRAALEAVQPFVQQAVQTQQQREQIDAEKEMQAVQQALEISRQRESQDFTGRQNELSRQLEERLNTLNQTLDLQKQREGLAFQGEQAQLDRDHATKLQSDQTYQQDWLNDRNFTREFNAQLSTLPVQNAFQMQQLVAQYALENPEVYTPQVVSGMTNFLQNNMMSILKQYFPNMVTTTGG